jgi:hypothetical protein
MLTKKCTTNETMGCSGNGEHPVYICFFPESIVERCVAENCCPIHVVTFMLISNLATDYIQKRRGELGLFSFEYNLSQKLIST